MTIAPSAGSSKPLLTRSPKAQAELDAKRSRYYRLRATAALNQVSLVERHLRDFGTMSRRQISEAVQNQSARVQTMSDGVQKHEAEQTLRAMQHASEPSTRAMVAVLRSLPAATLQSVFAGQRVIVREGGPGLGLDPEALESLREAREFERRPRPTIR